MQLSSFASLIRALLLSTTLITVSVDSADALQATVRWVDTAASENGFKIERKVGTGGSYSAIATTAANVVSYIDPSLSASTTYCYRVRAYNAAGNSAPSNEVCASTSVQKVRLSASLIGNGTLTSSPGGINCPSDCTEDYGAGTQVTLTPSAGSGTQFASWGGACTGQGSTCVVPMSATKNVTASFTQTGGDTPSANWTALPEGTTAASPTLTMYQGNLSLLVRGFEDRIYFTRRIGGSWASWRELGGLTRSEPGAVEFNGNLWVFIRGLDNGIYVNRLTATNWTGWSRVPGATLSGPRAVVFNNQLHLFIRGTNNRIYLSRLTGSGWTGWGEVPGGGLTLDAPTATVYQGTLDVVVRGMTNRIYHNTLSAAKWSGWKEVPGNGFTPSAPAATVVNGELWYFVQGRDNRLYQTRFAGGQWKWWSFVPGNKVTLSGPGATSTATSLYLVMRGTDNRVYLFQ